MRYVMQVMSQIVLVVLVYMSLTVNSFAAATSTPRYVYSNNGAEITDRKTGLIWRRCSEGAYWDTVVCDGEAEKFTYNEARQRAADQAGMTGFAWRLPTVQELKTIVNMDSNLEPVNGVKLAATDLSVFPQTPADCFWTSSRASENQKNIADIDFYDGLSGRVVGSRPSRRYYVRLVRTRH